MRRLYLLIYLAVLASLAVFALVAGLLWRQIADAGPAGQAFSLAATLAQNVLPPAGARARMAPAIFCHGFSTNTNRGATRRTSPSPRRVSRPAIASLLLPGCYILSATNVWHDLPCLGHNYQIINLHSPEGVCHCLRL